MIRTVTVHPLYRAEQKIATAYVQRRFEVERSCRSERPLRFEGAERAASSAQADVSDRICLRERGTLEKMNVRTKPSMSNLD